MRPSFVAVPVLLLILAACSPPPATEALPTTTAEMVDLGNRYRLGRGIAKDPTRAVQLYRQAGHDGNAVGMRMAGLSEEFGQGTDWDLADAGHLYLNAAYGRPPDALADILLEERWRGIHRAKPASRLPAVATIRAMADTGDDIGQALLARAYLKGDLVERDEVQALRLYRQASAAGNSTATVEIGRMQVCGKALNKDPVAACSLFAEAAAAGNPAGLGEYGQCIETGIGTARDPSRAADLYRQAGARDARAMTRLAGLLDRGEGVPKDRRAAIPLLEKAATLGDLDAAYELGLRSEDRTGAPRSSSYGGYSSFYKAATFGHPGAMRKVGDYYRDGITVGKNADEAAKWYEKANQAALTQECER